MRATAQTQIQMIFDKAESRSEATKVLAEKFYTGNELHDLLIYRGAAAVIGGLIHKDNAACYRGVAAVATHAAPEGVIRMAQPPLISERHRLRIHRASEVLRLLSARLPNDTIMAKARHEDIENAISTYEPQARDMLHKAAYFRAVLSRLPKGKSVGDVFDDAALTAIFKSTMPKEATPATLSRKAA